MLVRADVVTFSSSLICEELDRPRTGEEELEDTKEKENEMDAAERRKIRGEILKQALDFSVLVSKL